MGSLSQFFWYINAEKAPTELQKLHHYTHISITPELKKLRMDYQRQLEKDKKEQSSSPGEDESFLPAVSQLS